MSYTTEYLRLIRYKYHATSIIILLGYFLNLSGEPDFLLLSFSVVGFLTLYSGIYIFNDISDFSLDSNNPDRKRSPLQSRKITTNAATWICITHLLTGLAIFYLIDFRLLYFGLFFILFNLLYTLAFKKIPFVEIVANGVTYPARYLLGVYLATGTLVVVEQWQLLFSILLVASGIASTKRLLEFRRNRNIRPTFSHYNEKMLVVLANLLTTAGVTVCIFTGAHIFIMIIVVAVFLYNITITTNPMSRWRFVTKWAWSS